MMKPSPALLAVLLRRTRGMSAQRVTEALSPVEYVVYGARLSCARGPLPPKRTCEPVSRMLSTWWPWRLTRSIWKREGWFVLVRGAAHHLDTEAERVPIIAAGLA